MDIDLLKFFTDTAIKLESIAKNKTFNAIFEAIANRSEADSVDVYSLKRQLAKGSAKTISSKEKAKILRDLSTGDVKDFFSCLVKLNLGTLEPYADRKLRFKSAPIGIRKISLLALNRGNEITKMDLSKFKQDKKLDKVTSDKIKKEMKEYTFDLRPDVALNLKLPNDLTKNEAERLGFFIRSLAIS